MSNLAENHGIPDPSEVSMRPTAQRYGLLGALILIVIGLAFNLSGMISYTDQSDPVNIANQIIQLAVIIGVIVTTIKTHKNEELGGYITLGRAFKIGALAGIIIAIITGVWSYVFMTFIDPDIIEIIRENAYEQALAQGTSESDLEAGKAFFDFFTGPGFISSMAAIVLVFISVIVSLVVGAVMKDEAPMFQ